MTMMVESPAKEWENERDLRDEEPGKKRHLFFFGKKKEGQGGQNDSGEKRWGFGKSGEEKPRKEKPPKKEKTPLTKEQKKKRKKRIIIGVVVVVVLAWMILPKMLAGEQLPMVVVTDVVKGDVSQTISGSGTVSSEIETSYFSPVGATVDSCSLQVGDTVERGDVLLTYDARELEHLYDQAELTGQAGTYGYQDAITRDNENRSEYNRSTHDIGILEQQVDDTEDSVDHLNNRVNEWSAKQAESTQTLAAKQGIQAELEEEQIAAQDRLEKAQADLKALEEQQGGQTPTNPASPDATNPGAAGPDTTTTGGTDGQGDPTPPNNSDPDTGAGDEAALEAARAEVAAAQQALDTVNKQVEKAKADVKVEQDYFNEVNSKLSDYEKRLREANESLADFNENLAKEKGIQSSSEAAQLTGAARAQLSTNQDLNVLNATITKEQVEKGRNGIVAEYSGVVTSVSVVEGGPVVQGGQLFTVASNEDVMVEMNVTRYDLEKMEEGQTATITMAGREYTGTVTRLSRLAEKNEKGTPVVKARVKIDNPDENVYLGLEANVSVLGNQAKDVLMVPVETVNTGQEGSFCYVVENGIIVKKNVETGLASDTMVEIVSGLEFGDKVVHSGGMIIEEGMQVMAVEG
ncbi:MAG: efflux RND transporter periplasmic adaptor subunit [Lachnospiraceae bacterium]|nr:efflux RND transporter periplasmic adaptor subunit [Lachnospiraceae bacterium]